MRTIVLAATTIVLAASTIAQTVIVPAGLSTTTEGSTYAYGLGYWRDARVQLAEGDLYGKVILVRRMTTRLDAQRTYYSYSGQGRKWTQVTIGASDVDPNKMTANLSTNVTGKVTNVFNAAFSLPGFTGTPSSSPSPFDTKFSYAFSVPYLANGKNKILWDFNYRGGVLANGYTYDSPYYWDGHQVTSSAANVANETYHPDRSAHNCRDSGVSVTIPALTSAITTVYNNLGSPTQSGAENKSQLELFSLGTAPGASVIQVVGIAGSSTGASIGAACNKLYINLAGFYLTFQKTASATIPTAYSGSTFITIPNNKAYTGLPLWAQSAWTDSKTGAFSLTNATTHMVPAIPPDSPDRVLAYSYLSGTNTYSYSYRYTGTSYYYLFPVIEYATK